MKSLLCALAIVLCSLSARADERIPEQLLPATTQVYARWDGVAAHRDAYRNSARGKMFSGETGQAVDLLLDQLNRKLKLALVGESLLEGVKPDELQRVHGDVKLITELPKLMADSGIVAGFEIRPPIYDISTIYNLARGNGNARDQLTTPQFLLTVVIPNAAANPALPALPRLLIRNLRATMKEQIVQGRKVIWIVEERDSMILAAWPEGEHFVFAFGNLPIDKMVAKIKDAGVGITSNPLYKELSRFKEFEVVTRGFIDVANVVNSFEKLVQGFAPEAWAVVEAAGLTGVKSACFWDGFEGEQSRGVIEINMPGPRKGLTCLFRPIAFKMDEMPPLPADLTRFAAARMDMSALYDALLLFFLLNETNNGNDEELKSLSPAERLQKIREKGLQEIDQAIGIKTVELFASLGDKVVTYQAPSDGILNLGQVIAISVKDEKVLKRCLQGLTRKLESSSRDKVTLKKRKCLDVEVNEFIVHGNSPVTVAYTIHDGWLVIGFQPQPVRGFIQRMKGKLPAWKPDERTTATLAKVPNDRCVIQVADPRPTLQWMLSIAPVVAGFIGNKNEGEPFIDAGLFPHAAEVNQHLFPNVSWCRDDGRIMRWESRDSLWLPFEFLGLELFAGYAAIVGSFAF